MQQRHNHKRGFNLIEAAIVLAVVGGVIGAIWVSAANFYENYKVNKTVEGVILSAKNIQKLISYRDAEVIGEYVPITSTLIAANAFPTDWIVGNKATDPLGNSLYVDHTQFKNFAINLRGVFSLSSCIKLITKMSSFGAMADHVGSSASSPSRLTTMNVSNGSGITNYLSDFPVSQETAKTTCNSVGNTRYY